MVSKIFSGALQGISAELIEIEALATRGLRSFNIVGLADKAIEEAKERVSAAIKNIGLASPRQETKRVLINLAPADIKKEGSLYDLPIALAYLLASGQTRFNAEKKLIAGELALDSRVKPIKGAFSLCLLAQEKNFTEIILPKKNEKEAALSCFLNPQKKIKIVGVENLSQTIGYLESGKENPIACPDFGDFSFQENFEVDFSWIKGQEHAKRALEIAAAGGHHLMLEGPPGTGKTLLAKSIVSILPPLEKEEILELTKIYSAAGLLHPEKPLLTSRPFRSPHHSSSETALIGGGNPPRPGEITLAHRGVLFLDEFPEFHRDVLESLRTPLEEGKITLRRARYDLSLPSRFSLIAAANPCPCGFYNHPERECSCTPAQIAAYRRKLASPLMDRIDIFSWVPSLKYEELINPLEKNQSEPARQRIKKAREIQKERFKNDGIFTNAEMNLPQIKKHCQIDNTSHRFLEKFVNAGKLSGRGYHRVLKVSRTIADLEGKTNISFEHISEAVSYRRREDFW